MGDREAADGTDCRPPVIPTSPGPLPGPAASTSAATTGRRAAHPSTPERADAVAYVGRRVARRPVDAPAATVVAAGAVLTIEPVALPVRRDDGRADLLDPGTIASVIAGLEPADQSTSFADEDTASLPLLPATTPAGTTAGKRRAVKHAGSRGPLFPGLPSAPLLLGLAALAVSAAGALTMTPEDPLVPVAQSRTTQASALTGVGGIGTVGTDRTATPSRASDRDLLAQGSGGRLTDPVEARAAVRSGELARLADQAETFSAVIELNQWQAPLESYRLTATYGQYGLWASYHTGLDFAAPSGSPINAVGGGTVTSAGYDGAYGNKTVVTLEDGTEVWYCHLSSFGADVGDTVRAGELIGYVGSTGNVTGPHLHLEVRPGGGDPVDPYAALVENGVQP